MIVVVRGGVDSSIMVSINRIHICFWEDALVVGFALPFLPYLTSSRALPLVLCGEGRRGVVTAQSPYCTAPG